MGDNNQFDPNAQYQQPGFDPNAQYQQPGYDPNAQYQQPGFDPNAQYQQPGFDPNAMYQQPQKAGPSFPGGSFVDIIKADPIRICAYIGLVFIFFSSFLGRWVYVKASFLGTTITEGAGLFASDGGILILYGILFMVLSIWGMVVEFGSLIPALNSIAAKYKSLPFSQFYIPCAAFILWLLAIFNSNFRMVVNSAKDVSYGSSGYGFVTWMCLIGIILLLVRPVMKIVKKEQYWDY